MAKIMVNVQKRLNGASVRANFLYGENIDHAEKKVLNNDFYWGPVHGEIGLQSLKNRIFSNFSSFLLMDLSKTYWIRKWKWQNERQSWQNWKERVQWSLTYSALNSKLSEFYRPLFNVSSCQTMHQRNDVVMSDVTPPLPHELSQNLPLHLVKNIVWKRTF